MHRFFVQPDTLTRQPVVLTGDQAHQVRRVLRMRLGERAELLDGAGWAYEGILVAVSENDVRFQIVRRWEATGESAMQVILCQAVLKGERFGWALQKGVEVGVSAFQPLICERNVVDDMAAVEDKRDRWERIIQEAAEQSGRALLPKLLPPERFQQWLRRGYAPTSPAPLPAREGGKQLPASRDARREVGDTPLPSPCGGGPGGEVRLLLWEGERRVSLRQALAVCNLAERPRIELLVGPEGGFTDDEVEQARRSGAQTVSLGPRILRAETAGVVAAALVLYEAGEL